MMIPDRIKNPTAGLSGDLSKVPAAELAALRATLSRVLMLVDACDLVEAKRPSPQITAALVMLRAAGDIPASSHGIAADGLTQPSPI